MIHEKFQDPIKVIAIFNEKRVQPKAIRWGKKLYNIKQVLNIHSTHNGEERIYFFSVATETEFFRLELHTDQLRWYLVEHYQE